MGLGGGLGVRAPAAKATVQVSSCQSNHFECPFPFGSDGWIPVSGFHAPVQARPPGTTGLALRNRFFYSYDPHSLYCPNALNPPIPPHEAPCTAHTLLIPLLLL